jgi:serine/threonine protein kinase
LSVTIGAQLGSHELIGLLGKGGMGEVYRARDTKLKREVAIKILPDEFSRDPDRVSRFSVKPKCSPRSTIRTLRPS